MAKEIHLEVEIQNTIENCWLALTASAYVKQYMFGSEIESEWEVGSDILFYIENEGSRMPMVYGKIEKFNKPNVFRHTLIPAGASFENTEENHIYCEYRLEEQSNGTSLRIIQGGFEKAVEGEERY